MPRPQPVDDTMSMIPMMNLVTILIPFVLMGASFAPLAVVDVSARSEGPSGVAGDAGDVARLLVTPEQISVEWQGQTVQTVRCSGGCTRYESVPSTQLGQALDALEVPMGTGLVVAVHADVPYDVVIAAMDASRGPDGESSFAGVSLGAL